MSPSVYAFKRLVDRARRPTGGVAKSASVAISDVQGTNNRAIELPLRGARLEPFFDLVLKEADGIRAELNRLRKAFRI